MNKVIRIFNKNTETELSRNLELTYRVIDSLTREEPVNLFQYLKKVESTTYYTEVHSVNVALISLYIAKNLGLGEKDRKKVALAGLLHDTGKICMDQEIIFKKGKLTDSEYEQIRRHPVLGYNILKDVDCIPIEAKICSLLHHEKLNGKGYPLGLTAESIPLSTRIVTAADILEAMTADRPYRKGLSYALALEYLQAEQGASIDPRVCTSLFDIIPGVAHEMESRKI